MPDFRLNNRVVCRSSSTTERPFFYHGKRGFIEAISETGLMFTVLFDDNTEGFVFGSEMQKEVSNAKNSKGPAVRH